MIGILLATHAEVGQGLINAAELIVGKQEQIKAVGLYHGDGIDEFKIKVEEALAAVDSGDGVMGFVDFLGGTPANTMMQLLGSHELRCIAGVNMPIMLEAAINRGNVSLLELEDKLIQDGRENIIKLSDVADQFECSDNENDF